MNILKKILAVVAVICIIVGAVGIGAYYNGYLDGFLGGVFDRFTRVDVPESDFHYELVEPEDSTFVCTLGDDDSYEYNINKFEKMLTDTDAAYLWEGELYYNYDLEDYAHDVESVSKDEFDRRMENAEISEGSLNEKNPCFDADKLKIMASGIIQRLTNTSTSIPLDIPGKTEMIVVYNETSQINCFDNVDVGTEGGKEFFSKEKLSLQCDNIEVGTILSGEDLMYFCGYVAKVSADVTCKKNKGRFKDSSWIPAEDETKRIEFLVFFSEWNPSTYYFPIIKDIRVIS